MNSELPTNLNTRGIIDYDHYGDYNISISEMPSGLYYYCVLGHQFSDLGHNEVVVPPIEAVASLTYAPYLVPHYLGDGQDGDIITTTIKSYNLDVKRFPLKDMENNVKLPEFNGKVNRVLTHKHMKTIGTFNPWYVSGKNVGGARNWRNEGKLWQFPFTYKALEDGYIEHVPIKQSLCQSGNSDIFLFNPITPSMDHAFFIEGYKGDMYGDMEANYGSTDKSLPICSNAYLSFMNQNQYQNAQQKQNIASSSVIAGLAAAATIGIGVATGGLGLMAAGGIAAGAAATSLNGYNSLRQLQAQERDMASVPSALKSRGSNIVLDSKVGRGGLTVDVYQQNEDYMNRVGDFLAMYGYAQHKAMRPNVRNRYYYNYIKTSGVNITNKDGVGIPKEHFNKIKAIYDNGTTIWHISRAGVNVGDYSMDNYEV